MFTKVTGENGKAYIYDDKNQKKELPINDVNVIDAATIINNQEYVEEIVKELVKENLYLNLTSVIFFVIRLILLNIITFAFFGILAISKSINILTLIPIITSLSTFTSVIFLIKDLIKNKTKKENNNFAINYLVNELLKLKNKEQEIYNTKTYALIRNGQEFMIKDDEQFRNCIDFMCKYFNNRKSLNKQLKKSQNLKDDLNQCLNKPLSTYNFNPQNREKIESDIYNNILLSKQINKHKKRIRKK